jgi:ribosome silencing factor RsfS/YbeB/iojap
MQSMQEKSADISKEMTQRQSEQKELAATSHPLDDSEVQSTHHIREHQQEAQESIEEQKSQQKQLVSLKQAIIHALEDVKAKEITYIDVRKKTKLFDGVLICSAGSFVQARALAHHLIEELRTAGFQTRQPEGLESAEWVLVDCVDVVVHIMLPPIRAYYRLEEIWN